MLPFWFAPHPPRAAGEPASRGPESKDLSSRDERPILPRCHPHSAMPLSGRRVGLSRWWRDSRRSVLPCIAGALRRSLLASPGSSRFGPEAHGSIRSRRRSSLHQPLVLYAGAGKYSSRSQPVFECGPESTGARAAVSNPVRGKRRPGSVAGWHGGAARVGRRGAGRRGAGGAGPHSGHLPTRVARDEALGPLSCQLPTRVARGRTWGDVDRGHKPIRPRSSLTRPFQGRRAASRRDSCATRVAISWA